MTAEASAARVVARVEMVLAVAMVAVAAALTFAAAAAMAAKAMVVLAVVITVVPLLSHAQFVPRVVTAHDRTLPEVPRTEHQSGDQGLQASRCGDV